MFDEIISINNKFTFNIQQLLFRFEIPTVIIECYTNRLGVDYRGQVSITETGLLCQKWTDLSPQQHTTTSANFPGRGIGDHSYCRNPTSQTGGPWCYTLDPDTLWEYCNVSLPSDVCIGTNRQGRSIFVCFLP